jgi:hypothetical protein
VVTPSEQDFRPWPGAVDQHQGRGIARLAVGRRLVALRRRQPIGHVFSEIIIEIGRHRAFRWCRRCRFGV